MVHELDRVRKSYHILVKFLVLGSFSLLIRL